VLTELTTRARDDGTTGRRDAGTDPPDRADPCRPRNRVPTMVRRCPFTTGRLSSRQVVIGASSRSAAWRAGTARSTDPVQQVCPGQTVAHPEPGPDRLSNTGQRPALIVIPAGYGRPSVQHCLQFAQLGPGGACASRRRTLGCQRGPAPGRQGARHRFAGVRDTRNRPAASQSLALDSISSAADNRTCPRRARSPASSPPPSGYLMPVRYPGSEGCQPNS
jgi:hypothetical protein